MHSILIYMTPLEISLIAVFATAILGIIGFFIKRIFFKDKKETLIKQKHTGIGDNVAGDKVINNK